MIFASRSRRGADPYLPWKMGLFGLAAVLALLGIGLDSSLLVGAAILVLLGAVAFRLAAARMERAGEEGVEQDVEEGDPPSL